MMRTLKLAVATHLLLWGVCHGAPKGVSGGERNIAAAEEGHVERRVSLVSGKGSREGRGTRLYEMRERERPSCVSVISCGRIAFTEGRWKRGARRCA